MPKRSLNHSLALNFILAALAPIVLLSAIVLLHLAHDNKKETEGQSRFLAKSLSGQIEVFLHEPVNILSNIRSMLIAYPDWSDETVNSVINLHVRDSMLFESVYLLNENGIVIGVGLPSEREKFREEDLGISLAHLPCYISCVQDQQTSWSDIFLSSITGNISIALAIPVDERTLLAYLDIQFLSSFVQGLNKDQRFQITLIDRQGTIILHPDPTVGETLVNVSNLQIIQDGFAGSEEPTRFDFYNDSYIGSVKKIPGPDWLVLVSLPVKNAYHQMYVTAFSFLAVAVAAILMAVLYALIKARRITQPLTEITARALQIARGEYAAPFSPTPSPYRETGELVASIEDMADAVQGREVALQLSQKRFREIFNTTSEGIFIRNIQTLALVDANETMTRLFGYTLDELKEKSLYELSSGDPVLVEHRVKERINKALHEGPQVYEWNYARKDGDTFWAEVTLKKAEIDGKPRLLGVIRDITERKSLERQLIQSQKMEAIGTLAGGIAHDFNNILTPILGYVEIALLNINNPSKLQEDLNEVLRAVRRAKELVQQILAFSRQEGQQLAPTDVSIIVKEALKLLRSSIPATIEIRQDIDMGCPLVMANPTQIHQVLMNLCTNAYHAMREGGGTLGVTLRATSFTASTGHAPLNIPEGTYLLLEVSDTGHGMDKVTLGRILEPYFTTKGKDEGTGLGLSVVHGIVRSLGGEVSVTSEEGKGSVFQIYLPVPSGDMEGPVSEEQRQVPGGTENIYIVDDEKIILNMQKEILSNLGYAVQTFTRPEDALEHFGSDPGACDLVITDMTMPKMTGDVLTEKLREIRPTLPVILCTGFSEIISREKALALGINEFILKPFEPHKLARIVRRVLDEGR